MVSWRDLKFWAKRLSKQEKTYILLRAKELVSWLGQENRGYGWLPNNPSKMWNNHIEEAKLKLTQVFEQTTDHRIQQLFDVTFDKLMALKRTGPPIHAYSYRNEADNTEIGKQRRKLKHEIEQDITEIIQRTET